MSSEIISGRLKASLSKTLSSFYPLAGRIQGVSINCNDEGVVFVEARTNLLLSDFLRKVDTDSIREFLPETAQGESAGEWPLLSVKVSFFGSGSGVAVAICASHNIFDVASLATFVRVWANIARGKSSDAVNPSPQFAGTSIYPSPGLTFDYSSKVDTPLKPSVKFVTKRFLFESSKIAELKHKAASQSVPVPTRVEVISSLILRCAAKATQLNTVVPKSSLMMQPMDLRLRVPSNVLSHDAIGNLQTVLVVKQGLKSKMDLSETVVEFRKAKREVNELIQGCNNIDVATLGENLMNVMENIVSEYKPYVDAYSMSSWCRQPFYEVDFGFGSPVWIGSAFHTLYNNKAYVVLMDAKDGESVEAWVSLGEQDMCIFLGDKDLLSYASLNPPIYSDLAG
ncbi:hypothetical protein AALP_AAs50902U000900 [Arabis alpina]|uniref:Uncharacterized protein n=1 Tax=Arabis alpina TaxID=50452 RepID=A0A087G1D9_ARAAL|nr:hypothetical protein AALP_AAs50902U000900 [Arabis alpina]